MLVLAAVLAAVVAVEVLLEFDTIFFLFTLNNFRLDKKIISSDVLIRFWKIKMIINSRKRNGMKSDAKLYKFDGETHQNSCFAAFNYFLSQSFGGEK